MAHRGLEARLTRLDERSKSISQRAYARRLRTLAQLLREARDQPASALAVHRSDARTTLFQLQALARVHRETIDDEAFAPLQAWFKSIEDALGAVDFSDSIARHLG